jgi:hypothetical protein
MSGRGWFASRAIGITAALTKVVNFATSAAWAATAVTVFVAYPIALSLVEDRLIDRY